MAKISVEFDPKTQAFLRALQGVQREIRATGQRQAEAHRLMLTGWRRVGDAASAIRSSYALVAGSISTLVSATTQWITESDRQEAVLRGMRDALSAHSLELDATTVRMTEYAAEIQRTLGIGDDATERLITQVSRGLQGLDVTADDIVRVTDLARDMAQATGQSSDSIVSALTRMAAGHDAALSRIAPAMATQIADAGSLEEQLGTLESAYSGAASRGMTDFERASGRLSSAMGDIREAAGDLVRQPIAEIFTVIAQTAETAAGALSDSRGAWRSFISDALVMAAQAATLVVEGLARTVQLVNDIRNIAGTASEAGTGLLQMSALGEAEDMAAAAAQRRDAQAALVSDLEAQLYEIQSIQRQTTGAASESMASGFAALRRQLAEERAELQVLTDAATEAGYLLGARQDQLEAQRRDFDAQTARLIQQHDATQQAIDMVSQTRSALGDLIGQPLSDVDAGGGGVVFGGGAGGGNVFEQQTESVYNLQDALLSLVDTVDGVAGSLDWLFGLGDGGKLGPIGMTGKGGGKEGGQEDWITYMAREARERGLPELQGTLAQTSTALTSWMAGIDGAWQRLGQSMLSTMGSVLSDMGTALLQAQILGTASLGPIGWVLGLGAALVGAAARLGHGGSTSGGGRSSYAAADVLPAIMGDRSQAGSTIYYSTSIGAQITRPGDDDASVRRLSRTLRRGRAVGELPGVM